MKADDVKAFSDKYISRSGVVFRLVSIPYHNFGFFAFGISRAKLNGDHLQVEIERAINILDEKEKAKVTDLFNRFVRFYKDHWVIKE